MKGPSAGCGKPPPPNVQLGTWTDMADPGSGSPPPITVTAQVADSAGVKTYARGYWVNVPKSYDPNTPMKLIYEGAGCGAATGSGGMSNTSGQTVYDYTKVDNGGAILVGMDYGPPRGFCYDDQDPTSNDFAFFPILKNVVEQTFCVDTGKEFFSGYSSGSWLANQMMCAYPDALKGVVEATGGEPPMQPACVPNKPVAALFLHDLLDMDNKYDVILPACARTLKNNGCGLTTCNPSDQSVTMSWPVPASVTLPPGSTCVQFKGCQPTSPVVFCTTTQAAHYITVNAFIPGLFWTFINGL
jgi:hypothetical protein